MVWYFTTQTVLPSTVPRRCTQYHRQRWPIKTPRKLPKPKPASLPKLCYTLTCRYPLFIFQEVHRCEAGKSQQSQAKPCPNKGHIEIFNSESHQPSEIGHGLVALRGFIHQWCGTPPYSMHIGQMKQASRPFPITWTRRYVQHNLGPDFQRRLTGASTKYDSPDHRLSFGRWLVFPFLEGL